MCVIMLAIVAVLPYSFFLLPPLLFHQTFPASLSTHTLAVSVVQQMWGKDTSGSIGYFSEVEDKKYSTTNIGVPNTERGRPVCVLM